MTLFRQIALLTTIAFIVLIITVMLNNVRQSSQFLQGQLQTAAQDMATTLGITVANAAPDQDIASIETFVNASFDSGYYSNIKLVSTDGKILFEKSRDISLDNVPDWFINTVPLTSAVGTSQIIRGWMPYGTISVTLHPGYIYTGLFVNLESSAFWALVVAFAGLTVLWFLLHIVLTPLKRVREQAEAIQENKFIIQQDIPKTYELKQVVLAMNKMISKVKTVFDDQTRMLQRYQDLKFRDEETGLSNRLHFITKIENICKDETAASGLLVGIRITGFARLCEVEGFNGAKSLLIAFRDIVTDELKNYGWTLFGRLNKSEFALYLPGSREDNQKTIEKIFARFETEISESKKENYLWLYAGAVLVNHRAKVSDLLSNMDMLMTLAETEGAFSLKCQIEGNLDLPKDKKQWRKWLLESLREKRFFIVAQSTWNNDGSELHKEIYVRLRDKKNQIVTAGYFLPVATSLDMDVEIDKAVLAMVREQSFNKKPVSLALNISGSFLKKAEAMAELFDFIRACDESQKQLSLEITHIAFNNNSEVVEKLNDELKQKNFLLGVDHLDLNHSMETLKKLRPDYVKMNAKQLLNMAENGVSAGVHALLTLLHGLDIKLIAVGVDSQTVHDQLLDLGVDAMQGNYFGEFEELKP